MPQILIDLLDSVLYLDKKQVVGVGGVRLHPSESHLLMRALQGMSFTQIADTFAISKSAVSQVFARLAAKGVVIVTKDPRRRNAARVSLTPLGEQLRGQTEMLRADLADRIEACLAGYDPAERAAVGRFLGDLHQIVRTALVERTLP